MTTLWLLLSFCGVVLGESCGAGNTTAPNYPLDTIYFTPESLIECGCHAPGVVCVRKCCNVGYVLQNRTCVLQDNEFAVPLHHLEQEVYVDDLKIRYVVGLMNCSLGFYKFDDEEYEDEASFLQMDGRLLQPYYNESYDYDRFCMDDYGGGEVGAMVCFPEDEAVSELQAALYSIGMIISMPFLLITFIVYAVLPDRNLHGKSLMCYVISLFGAYVLLVIIQMSPHKLENNLCIGIGLSCLFCFMASFFWMNVMSIDIWWAFRGMRGISGSRKEAEQKRFLLYCLYAWGMPVVHVLLVLFLILVADLPPYAWYNPQFGNGKCWFKDGIPTFLYFFGPISALIITNIVLFVITACKINMVQRDTAVLRKDENKRHSYENDKQRFNLYLKLMLAMGVNWSMEIISWAVIYWQVGNLPTYIWYLTDACNALYGVVIFFIFVFKRNIWKLLKRRYYLVTGRPHLARSVTQNAYSPRTTTSTLSHTIDSKSGNYTTESSVYTSEVA